MFSIWYYKIIVTKCHPEITAASFTLRKHTYTVHRYESSFLMYPTVPGGHTNVSVSLYGTGLGSPIICRPYCNSYS